MYFSIIKSHPNDLTLNKVLKWVWPIIYLFIDIQVLYLEAWDVPEFEWRITK